MTDEPIEQWAARVAPTLTGATWEALQSLEAGLRIFGIVVVDSKRAITSHGWALLAFRDSVAARLTDNQREVLSRLPDAAVPRTCWRGGVAGLDRATKRRPRLVALSIGLVKRLPFGREIASTTLAMKEPVTT